MKQRIVTGLLWGSLAILTMVFMWSRMMGILIALFSTAAVFEIAKVTGVKNVPIRIISMIVAGSLPLVSESRLLERYNIPPTLVLTVYVILLLSLLLASYEKTKYEHVAIVIFSSLWIPYALSCFMLVRDVYKEFPAVFGKPQGFFLFILGVTCSWMTDAFAYFTGYRFGKHKMSPVISPKKTYEGAAGGLVLTALLNVLVLFVFNRFFFNEPFISYWLLIPFSIGLSFLGMLGDLSASAIKRNFGVKDFGNLMKGHGGVMDRFDSCIFVFPAIYASVTVSQLL